MGKSFAILSILVLILSAPVAWADEPDAFTRAINTFIKASLTQPFFESAFGYAVFPTVGKGGFVVGGCGW